MPDTARLRHTPDERRQALVIHAASAGRAELIEPLLREAGLSIKVPTLRDWTRRFKDEYEQIRQEYEAYVRSGMAEMFNGVAGQAIEVSQEAIRQLGEAVRRGEVSPKDLPKAAVSAMTVAGISVDKSQLLSGNPTSIVKTSTDDLQRELASVGITIVMPGQADQKPAAIDVQAKPTAELDAGA